MQQTFFASDLGNGLRYLRTVVTFTDLQTLGANTTGNLALFTLPKHGKIMGVVFQQTVQFAGTGPWSALTVSLGRAGGSGTDFASAQSIFAAPADTTIFESAGLFKAGGDAAIGVNAFFVVTGGNFNVATAGSVNIDVMFTNVTTP